MISYRCFVTGSMGTNSYVVWEGSSAVVIDPDGSGDGILAFLLAENLTLYAVLLTHGHCDHIGAVKRLTAAFVCPVYAAQSECALLSDSDINLSAWLGDPFTLTPDRAVMDGDIICAGSLIFTVLSTPGHTAGSVCYRIEQFLFAGDTLFCGSAGRTDFPTGNLRALHASLARIFALDDELCVLPGHGEATTIARERRSNPFAP